MEIYKNKTFEQGIIQMKHFVHSNIVKTDSIPIVSRQLVLKVGVFDSWHDEFNWQKNSIAGRLGVRSLENLYDVYQCMGHFHLSFWIDLSLFLSSFDLYDNESS